MVPMKGGLPGNSFFSCLFLSLFCFGGRGSFPNHTEMALSEGAHTSEMAPSVSLRDALDSDNTTPPPERLAVLLTGQASIWLRRMTKRRQRASRTCLPHLLPPALARQGPQREWAARASQPLSGRRLLTQASLLPMCGSWYCESMPSMKPGEERNA